jgi:hypothetical protein
MAELKEQSDKEDTAAWALQQEVDALKVCVGGGGCSRRCSSFIAA